MRGIPRAKTEKDVKYYLLKKKPGDDEAHILAVFHYCGSDVRFLTGEKVPIGVWDKKARRVKQSKKFTRAAEVNEHLANVAAAVLAVYREFKCDITPAEFKNEITYRMGWQERPEDTSKLSLIEFIEKEYIEHKRQKLGHDSFKSVRTHLKHILEYSNSLPGGLNYTDVTPYGLDKFRQWLYAEPRALSISTTTKIIKALKAVMVASRRKGLHDVEVYDDTRTERIKTPRVTVGFDELERLFALDLSEHAEGKQVTRDLFLLGCYTGLRFSDFSRLKPDYVIREGDKALIQLPTRKTNTWVSIPLLPIAEAVLEKYGYQVPTISNQKFNKYIKELCHEAGITENVVYQESKGGKIREATKAKYEMIASHTCRRSFATNFYRMGIPASKLMPITGHATEAQFMQYVGVGAKENALELHELMSSAGRKG